ncbi:hypothetical protein TPAR_08538 [Tolypocladium paradoxum]|uniref:Uncharacterized protein n=1 Tax=Tolypocladium paradoxum TaxID=94208 RepID=A0A2S4KM28_9HYPO|nr:hypothetical protein TPAR_08538 [Tolypocladium paradoxum]
MYRSCENGLTGGHLCRSTTVYNISRLLPFTQAWLNLRTSEIGSCTWNLAPAHHKQQHTEPGHTGGCLVFISSTAS